MRFRKKPVEIEAHQLDKLTFPSTLPEWLNDAIMQERVVIISQGSQHPVYAEINTPEGRMIASPGDWIIKGIEGEIYPCKPSIFDKTYEFVADGVIDTWAGRWVITIENPERCSFAAPAGPNDLLRVAEQLVAEAINGRA